MIGSGKDHLCIRQAVRDAKTAKGFYESGIANEY